MTGSVPRRLRERQAAAIIGLRFAHMEIQPEGAGNRLRTPAPEPDCNLQEGEAKIGPKIGA
jgi:hypothetical protein